MQMFSSGFLHVMHANEDMAWYDNGALPHAEENTPSPLEGAVDALTSDLLSNLTLTSAACRQTIRSLSHSANGNETAAATVRCHDAIVG